METFFIGNENVGVIQYGFHFIGIGDHVSGGVASVELHAFYCRQLGHHGLAFFHGDHAVFADLFHCVGHDLSHGIVAGGDGCDLCDREFAVDFFGTLFNFGNGGFDSLVDPFSQNDGVGACGEVFEAFADDRLRKHDRSRGAVARDVVGLRGNFLHELRAHVFERVFQLDFFGDGHAVVGDEGSPEFFIENHVSAFRPEGDFNSIRERIDARFQSLSRFVSVFDLFSHNYRFLLKNFDKFLRLFNDRQNIALPQNGKFFSVDFEFASRIFRVENHVADLDLHSYVFSVDHSAGAYRNDSRRLRFFLCRRGENESALGLFFRLNAFNKYSVK